MLPLSLVCPAECVTFARVASIICVLMLSSVPPHHVMGIFAATLLMLLIFASSNVLVFYKKIFCEIYLHLLILYISLLDYHVKVSK